MRFDESSGSDLGLDLAPCCFRKHRECGIRILDPFQGVVQMPFHVTLEKDEEGATALGEGGVHHLADLQGVVCPWKDSEGEENGAGW